MWNRQYRCRTDLWVVIGQQWLPVANLQAARKAVYANGIAGKTYRMFETVDGEVLNEWALRWKPEGPIFTKNVYSKWKTDKKRLDTQTELSFLSSPRTSGLGDPEVPGIL